MSKPIRQAVIVDYLESKGVVHPVINGDGDSPFYLPQNLDPHEDPLEWIHIVPVDLGGIVVLEKTDDRPDWYTASDPSDLYLWKIVEE